MARGKVILFFIVFSACGVENELYDTEFKQIWSYCYESRFTFPGDNTILEDEYLQCNLDGDNILLNNKRSGLEGTVFYSHSFSTPIPNTPLTGINETESRLHISFVNFEYYKQISIVIRFPTDSLNYTIQQAFSQPGVSCATNFENEPLSFKIGTSCTPNGNITFSTQYSTREDQNINIDSFTYKNINGFWYYHLEYSFDELEITNEILNERTNNEFVDDPYIHQRNLLVKDMKCVIDFELPED